MATTQWKTLERITPRTWLLSNGEVITEPALQESGSGRRVRIHNASQSEPLTGLESMLSRIAQSIAKRKKTTVLLELTHEYRYLPRSRTTLEQSARAHLIHDPDNREGVTQCWWTFRHPALPLFEATLVVSLTSNENNLHQDLEAILHMPVQDNDATTDTYVVEVVDATYETVVEKFGFHDHDLKMKWKGWLADNPPAWPAHVLTDGRVLAGPRQGIKALLETVRSIDDIDTIQVPDGRELTEPSWMDLRLVSTNVNGQFIDDLRQYLDGTLAVEVAVEQYQALLATLRSLGVDVRVTGEEDNDFAAAMLAGASSHVVLPVHNPVGDNGFSVDDEHSLSIHLPTGTMIVECNHTSGDTDAIKQRWEEDRLIARLTGEEPALLAYARQFAKHQYEGRVGRAIEERS